MNALWRVGRFARGQRQWVDNVYDPWDMAPPMPPRLAQLGHFGLRALRIAASTVSIIELLRSEWAGGISAGVAWLVFVQVERRLAGNDQEPEA